MARVAAVWAGAIVGLTVSACFVKPDSPGATTDDGGTTAGDATTVDGPVTPCAVRDTFSGTGAPCGGWGVFIGSAGSGGSGNQNIYRNGELVMASSGHGGSAACVATTAVPFTNVVVQIPKVISGGHTGIELRFSDSETFRAEVQSSQLAVHDGTQTTWSSFSTMVPFLRLRRVGDVVNVAGSDGATGWMSISSHAVASPLATVTISLYADFRDNTGYVIGAFDNLDGCAP